MGEYIFEGDIEVMEQLIYEDDVDLKFDEDEEEFEEGVKGNEEGNEEGNEGGTRGWRRCGPSIQFKFRGISSEIYMRISIIIEKLLQLNRTHARDATRDDNE